MTELDKKIQKAQVDLVQAVMEAHERKNLERVDMLVTNAVKQLKMSRFKPDQTTCISLTYLAKTNPRIFSQSNAIKDVLKSLLRRDTGPANIKGKNDTILPILAANILLASCDSTDIRVIVLNKIEQWLNSQSQKVTELIQHLLATLCLKCKNDRQTIGPLIEMRQHWLQYLDDNFETYGPVPNDLCKGVRNLLQNESNCISLISYLKFLLKHDTDVEGLTHDIGRFILLKPITLNSMQKDKEVGIKLNKLILKIFIKLLFHLRAQSGRVIPKIESGTQVKMELKSEFKEEEIKPKIEDVDVKVSDYDTNRNESNVGDGTSSDDNESSGSSTGSRSNLIYVRLPGSSDVIKLSESTLEAILTLLSVINMENDFESDFDQLLNYWIAKEGDKIAHLADMYEDPDLTVLYNIPISIRQKLIHSANDILVELGLYNSDLNQLINLLQQFGSPLPSLNKILEKLESFENTEFIKSEIVDPFYFSQLVEFYSDHLGVKGAKELSARLGKI